MRLYYKSDKSAENELTNMFLNVLQFQKVSLKGKGENIFKKILELVSRRRAKEEKKAEVANILKSRYG